MNLFLCRGDRILICDLVLLKDSICQMDMEMPPEMEMARGMTSKDSVGNEGDGISNTDKQMGGDQESTKSKKKRRKSKKIKKHKKHKESEDGSTKSGKSKKKKKDKKEKKEKKDKKQKKEKKDKKERKKSRPHSVPNSLTINEMGKDERAKLAKLSKEERVALKRKKWEERKALRASGDFRGAAQLGAGQLDYGLN